MSNLANAFSLRYSPTVTPYFYQSDVFIVPEKHPNTVVKHTLEGVRLWDIKLNGDVLNMTARFNQLFVLDKTGDLTVYNTVTGMKLWDILDKAIMTISIQYPNLVYLSRDEKIGRIRIDEGIIDWELPLRHVEAVGLMGHSDWIVGIGDAHLYLIEISDGNIAHQLDAPHSNMRIKTTFNSGAILSGNGELYHLTTDPLAISPTLPPSDIDRWTQEKYRLSYSDTKKTLSLYDDENRHLVWKNDLPFALRTMYIHYRTVLMVDADTGQASILNLPSNKSETTPHHLISLKSTAAPIIDHYHHKDRYYLLTPEAIMSYPYPSDAQHER